MDGFKNWTPGLVLGRLAALVAPMFMATESVPGSRVDVSKETAVHAAAESVESKLARFPGWSLRDIELYEQELDRRTSLRT